jgi:ATP-dependent Clp protease protease subunit
LGGVAGQASDITIEAEEILKMRERINRIIARETGQSYDRIVKDTDRNFWISAQDAVSYGLVSKIVSRTEEA